MLEGWLLYMFVRINYFLLNPLDLFLPHTRVLSDQFPPAHLVLASGLAAHGGKDDGDHSLGESVE